jgi:hypothetical protein
MLQKMNSKLILIRTYGECNTESQIIVGIEPLNPVSALPPQYIQHFQL